MSTIFLIIFLQICTRQQFSNLSQICDKARNHFKLVQIPPVELHCWTIWHDFDNRAVDQLTHPTNVLLPDWAGDNKDLFVNTYHFFPSWSIPSFIFNPWPDWTIKASKLQTVGLHCHSTIESYKSLVAPPAESPNLNNASNTYSCNHID